MSAEISLQANAKGVLDDVAFAPFLNADFNSTEYASSILKNPDASATIRTDALQKLVDRLVVSISSEVESKQDDLLGHARRLQTSEKSLQRIKGAVTTLSEATHALNREIAGPFVLVQQQSTQLANLHKSIEVLRAVNLRLKQTSKLRQLVEDRKELDPMELAKAAKICYEIESGVPEDAIAGITVLDRDARFINDSKQKIVTAAYAMLDAGMTSLGQADIATALQVFFNLGTLRTVARDTIRTLASDAETALKKALDARQLSSTAGSGGARASGPGGNARVQEALWQALETCIKTIHSAAVATWHLQRVISKKRDPLTLAAFIDVVQDPGDGSLLDFFWATIAEAFGKAVQTATSRGGLVRDTLTHSFPRLHANMEAMLDRCLRDTDVPNVCSAVENHHRVMLTRTLGPFQEAFMSTSFARMQEAVNGIYPATARSVPTSAAVQQCIGCLYEELKASSKSGPLAALIAITVGRAIALLCSRASLLMFSGQELRDISGSASAAQLRNIALSSQLHDIHRSLVMLLPKLPPTAAEVLCDPLEHLQSVAVEAVLPLFKAASEAVEDAILQMHTQDWASSAGAAILQTSPYILRLQKFLQRFRSDFLAHFVPQPTPNISSFAALLCQRLAARTLTFFVRHAALLKPLGQQGKLQIAKDASELEAIMRQHLFPPDLLREAHNLLKAFRTLLFTDVQAVGKSQLLNTIPASTVLLHFFSRLPDNIKNPYQRTGISVKQYSQWMDQHGCAEILKSISDAVNAAQPDAGGDVLQAMRSLTA